MAGPVQQRLVDYLNEGGKVLLVGEVPEADLEGRSCTVLRDALGLVPVGRHHGTHAYFPALCASGWAAPLEEMRVGFAQTFATVTPDVLLRLLGTEEACGFDIAVGAGRAIVLTTNLNADPILWAKVFSRLGVSPALGHGCAAGGIFMTSTRTPDRQRLLHLLNLDGFAKVVRPTEHGSALFGGRDLRLGPKAGVMLPLGVRLGPGKIEWATTEIVGSDADSVTFRVTQPEEVVVIVSDRPILPSADYTVRQENGAWTVTSRPFSGWDEETLVVRFGE